MFRKMDGCMIARTPWVLPFNSVRREILVGKVSKCLERKVDAALQLARIYIQCVKSKKHK